jgi:hypothetical protein
MASMKLLLILASFIAICAAFPQRIHQTNNRKSSRGLETLILNNTVELDPEGFSVSIGMSFTTKILPIL